MHYFPVFRPTNLPRRAKLCSASHVVAPSSGYNLTEPAGMAPHPLRRGGTPTTLMEFLTPSTLEPERVHSTPVCLAGYVPPSGFLTLSTVYSSPRRPTLFQAGNALGVSLFRGLLPTVRFQRLFTSGIALLVFLLGARLGSMGVEAIAKAPRVHRQSILTFRALLQQLIRAANDNDYEVYQQPIPS